MNFTVYTNKPLGLLAAIKKAIDDNHIKTWEYDNVGDFTHTPEQFYENAWLRPDTTQPGELGLKLVWPQNVTQDHKNKFGPIYFGRFSEMLLGHFRSLFTKIELIP